MAKPSAKVVLFPSPAKGNGPQPPEPAGAARPRRVVLDCVADELAYSWLVKDAKLGAIRRRLSRGWETAGDALRQGVLQKIERLERQLRRAA